MIPVSHSHEYSDLQDIYKSLSCLEILKVVFCVRYQYFEKLGTQTEEGLFYGFLYNMADNSLNSKVL